MSNATKTHRHKAISETTQGYTGGVSGKPGGQEPRAAGGICVVARCACGAVKRTNRNNGYSETSGWYVPAEVRS